jgi:gamma-butyrobetaine dioxygenase
MGRAKAQSHTARISYGPRYLLLDWSDGHQSGYDAIWLWDNAPEHRDQSNGQRLIDVTDLPADPVIASAYIQGGDLAVRWAESGSASHYELIWLRENCYCGLDSAPPDSPVVLWRAAESAWLTRIEADEVWRSEKMRHTWLMAVALHGIAFLRGAPRREGLVLELARLIGYVRETNYGRVFDVRAAANPNNLAYSDLGLGLHTDNPYRDPVPGLQVLHCITPSEAGGASLFADGFAVAESLRSDEPGAFSILAQTPIRFAFRDAAADLSALRPMIQLDLHGRIEAVHYNSRSIAPIRLRSADVVRFYSAYRAFSRRLHSREFLFETRLEAGDIVLFDNRRVLHGRTPFNVGAAARHLQGCYLDRDGMLSTIAMLEKKVGGNEYRR